MSEFPPSPEPIVPEVPEDTIDWESVNASHEVSPSIESLAIGEATREYEQRKIEAEALEKENEASKQLAVVKENLGLQSDTTSDEITDAEFEDIAPELAEAYEGEANYSAPALHVPEKAEILEKPAIHLPDESHENIEDVLERFEQRRKNAENSEQERVEDNRNKESKEKLNESQESDPTNNEGQQEKQEGVKSKNAEQARKLEEKSAKKAAKKSSKEKPASFKGAAVSGTKFAGWGIGAAAGVAAVAWPTSVAVSTLAGTPVFAAAGTAANLTGPLALGAYALMGAAFGIYCARNLVKEWPTLKKELTAAAGRLFRKGSGKK
jgi:hypothetical protein